MRLVALAAALSLLSAPASAADASHVDGVWEGGYICGQGKTFLRLTLDGGPDGVVTGTFYFTSASWNGGSNLTVPEGEYRVSGNMYLDGKLFLNGVGWNNQPYNYSMVGLEGRVETDAQGTHFSGRVIGDNCTNFSVRKK
jgi:hypothetical protein